jgi:integrase/recombinase XerD
VSKSGLPLPQDVGESILHYLKCARPQTKNDYVFMTTVAPYKPITRQIVGRAVVRALPTLTLAPIQKP